MKYIFAFGRAGSVKIMDINGNDVTLTLGVEVVYPENVCVQSPLYGIGSGNSFDDLVEIQFIFPIYSDSV